MKMERTQEQISWLDRTQRKRIDIDFIVRKTKVILLQKEICSNMTYAKNPTTMRVRDGGNDKGIWGSAPEYPFLVPLCFASESSTKNIMPAFHKFFGFYFASDLCRTLLGVDFISLDECVASRKAPAGVSDRNFNQFLKKWEWFSENVGNQSIFRAPNSHTVRLKDFIMNYLGRNKLTFGFDTEWSDAENGDRFPLSYQFYTEVGSYKYEFIFLANGNTLGLGDMLYYLVNVYFKGFGFLIVNEKKPNHKTNYYESCRIMLVAHFGGVDYSLCSDWTELLKYSGYSTQQKKMMVNIRKSLEQLHASYKAGSISRDVYEKDSRLLEDRLKKIEEKPTHKKNLTLSDKHCLYTTSPRVLNLWVVPKRLRCEFNIEMRDTMKLSPPGSALADLGAALGVPKLDTEAYDVLDGHEKGYYKSHMNELLANHPDFFEEYASMDAVITYKWYAQVVTYLQDGVTISSIAASEVRRTLKNYCTENDIDFESYDKTVRGFKIEENKSNFGAFYSSRLELGDIPDRAYIGGRNECFTHGLITDVSYDYDLRSAYPFGMQMIPEIAFEKDLITFKDGHVLQKSDWKHIAQAGFGHVRFEFPRDVAFPTIPLKSTKNDLKGTPVFLRTGEGLACAPDIYAALEAGATVTVLKQGFRFFDLVEKSDVNLGCKNVYSTNLLGLAVRELVKKRAEMSAIYGKKSVQALLYKIVCNSIYGKTGQGLHGNTARNIVSGEMEDIPQSSITDGVMASTITAVVRMTLALIMNFIADTGYKVHSVTTDGFITDFPVEKQHLIDEYLNSISSVYKEVLYDCWGEVGTSILEIKHLNKTGFFNIKTRGNIGFHTKDPDVKNDMDSVFAGAGYKGDATYRRMSGAEQRAYLLDLVLNRKGRIIDNVSDMHSLRDMKEMSLKRITKHFEHSDDRFKGLSMDYDKKRFLLEREFSSSKFTIGDRLFKSDYGFFNTRPFDSMEEYEAYAENHSRFINLGHNVRSDVDYKAFSYGVTYGIPSPPFKLSEKVYRFTSDELVKRQDLYTTYSLRQFYILLLLFPEDMPPSPIKTLSRKELLMLVDEVYDVNTFNLYKNVQKLKKDSSFNFDLVTALQCFDSLHAHFYYRSYVEEAQDYIKNTVHEGR